MKRRGHLLLAALGLLAAAALALWIVLPVLRVDVAERAALSQLGKPYVFGADGPESFDCSGLMKYAYARAGVRLAHHAKTVANDDRYRTVSEPSELRRGDLVFFDTLAGGSRFDHVGLWLGGGRFVHASSARAEVVVSEFDEKWRKRFTWAKRVV